MKWQNWLPAIGIGALIVGILAWRSQDGEPTVGIGITNDEVWQPKSDRPLQCTDTTGEPMERLVACLPKLRSEAVSAEGKATIEKLASEGKVLAFADLDPLGVAHEDPSAELLQVLMGTDEQAANEAIREAGYRAVVIDRDLGFSLDRDNKVLARLTYRDFYQWFQLRHVTTDLLVYSVRNTPIELPSATADRMLEGLRARLAGERPEPQRWRPEAVRLLGTMRLQGETLAVRHAIVSGGKSQSVVDRALDELAAKLRREWEREVQTMGMGRLEDRLDDLRLEIHVVMERAPVDPRSKWAIFELWEQGIDGMMFKQRPPKKGEKKLDEKFTYMPGSELTTNSFKSADQFLRHAVREFGWNDTRPWEKDPRTQLDIIRTQHFMEAEPGGGPAVRLMRGLPIVEMSSLTDKRIQDMLIAGGEWWLYNERPDKSYEYKYWPTQNRRSDDYNEVRHILAARDLADTWRYRHDPRYLEASKRSMEWLRQFEILGDDPAQGPLPHPQPGQLLFRYPSYALQAATKKQANQKLGTVAVALLGWLAWAEATGDHSEDERIRQMAKFTAWNQEADGRFKPYYVHKGHSYENERNDIVPGEAMLALGIVAEYFDEPEWVTEAYPKFIEYYRPWFRDRKVRVNPYGRWPHHTYANQDRLDMVQFGPWSVMAAKQYVTMTGDKEAAEFGLEVADWMIDYYQWRGENSPWPDFVGGYYKLPNETPAMQTFCYSEGTAAAYHIAATTFPDRKDKYDIATRESIRFLDVMQFDPLDSYFVADPAKVRGGIKYTMTENKVRIDYVGHGLSTLSQYLDARAADPAVQLDIHDPNDLERPAGVKGSVPYLDYSGVELAPANDGDSHSRD
jgi:hypothetical protein